ncbi:hypothetical protein MC885_019143 [Smutsia gigantea]|nr:hypothetical protein MC885_019143 [Smutsia gigantea]
MGGGGGDQGDRGCPLPPTLPGPRGPHKEEPVSSLMVRFWPKRCPSTLKKTGPSLGWMRSAMERRTRPGRSPMAGRGPGAAAPVGGGQRGLRRSGGSAVGGEEEHEGRGGGGGEAAARNPSWRGRAPGLLRGSSRGWGRGGAPQRQPRGPELPHPPLPVWRPPRTRGLPAALRPRADRRRWGRGS